MRRAPTKISSTASLAGVLLALALASALAGCGSSAPGGGAAAKKEGNLALTSSAIEGGELPARYTCDGANTAPPLKWGGVPGGTRELVLFAVGKAPAGSSNTSATIEWAIAGVKPELHELSAGQLPAGAFLEQASDGKKHYSICPPKGQSRQYAFAVYAVPPKVIVTPKINGPGLYHNLAEGPPQYRALASGAISTTYTRR